MISEREYIRLIKRLPMEKCPPDFSRKVMVKTGIYEKPDRFGTVSGSGNSMCYTTACLAVSVAILVTGYLNIQKSEFKEHYNLAANTTALMDQLAEGARVMLTGR